MNPKVSNFVIALLLVGIFIVTISTFISKASNNYGNSFSMGATETTLNRYEEINELTERIQAKSQNATSTNVFDVLGNYFSQGYDALKITANSFAIFNDMATTTSDKAHIPSYIRTTLIAIVTVLIIIGIWLSVIVKREV